ncbi:hypothetical protein [uncultured Corynebacterium sp.]|uniref:hypothetical protein n=1 Tax=uncultured Corynebacterium sp. TaxID=159447 RepID=UPI0025934CC9|nr:hypothetical protein [uncultured Corynebacterium sp.]
MVSPSDLNERREQQALAEHDAVFGEARRDVGRLFHHFGKLVGKHNTAAALLTLATILAVPEGEPYA